MNFRRKIAIILTFAMVTSLFTLNIASVFAETAGEEDSGTAVAEEQSGADQTTEVPSEQATEPEPGSEDVLTDTDPDATEPEEESVDEEPVDADGTASEDENVMEEVPEAEAVEEEDEEPGEPPATVSTADSRSDGITMNLFDYDLTNDQNAGDTWDNSPTSDLVGGWPSAGINNGGNLKFFGHGGEPTLEGNTNRYTGEAMARQGIVDETLGEDGYPIMTDFNDYGQNQSLARLFSPDSSEFKTVYSDVNHLFQKDGNGNYTFNSDNNYAYYDPSQGSGGDFKVYDGTYKVYPTVAPGTDAPDPYVKDMNVGYFPFDDWDESKDQVTPALDTDEGKAYNHQHGLTMECDFIMPPSGTAEGDDIVFNFSGDDDAWLFVDGVLVMDIGGLHLPTGGSVNFTTGEINIDSAVDVVPYSSSAISTDTIGTENTLAAVFEAAGKEWDPTAEHTFKFFYLERGGCYSNLALETNIWKVTGLRFNVEKVWNDDEDHSGDTVTVDLYADGELVEGKTLTLSTDNDWKDAFNNLPMYNEDGGIINYTVKEENVDDYDATYEKGGEVVKEKTYWVPIDAKDIEDGETYAITAPNWNDGKEPHDTRIFEGTEGLIETVPVTLKEQTVPGENQEIIDDEGTYDQILKKEPTADQMFVATNVGSDSQQSGDFWTLSNGSGNLTLVGNRGWWWTNYWYTMSGSNGWLDPNNYQNALTIEAEGDGTAMIYAAQYWDNPPELNPPQYLYLNNGTHPDPTNVRDYSAHVTFWKQVTVEETTPLPDDWTITNSPAGDLTVEKTVKGTDAQKAQEFTFVVTLDDDTINGTYGEMSFKHGVAMFTLSDGESLTAEDLPVGISYSVIEAAGKDYTAEFTGETGEIEAKTEKTASFRNTFKKDSDDDDDNKDDQDDDQDSDSDGSSTSDDDSGSGVETGDTGFPLEAIIIFLLSGGILAVLIARRRFQ